MRRLVLLGMMIFATSCASSSGEKVSAGNTSSASTAGDRKLNAEYLSRVETFGRPDVIADYSKDVPVYYSFHVARTQRPPKFEVYYYVSRNEQVLFRPNMAPAREPIPPKMQGFIRDMAAHAPKLPGDELGKP